VQPDQTVRVTVWGEGRHEQTDPAVARRYPGGMHEAVADGIREHLGGGVVMRTAALDDAEQGLPPSVLDATDVLVWWGHVAHDEVDDELVERLHTRVLAGMGLVVLHSGHHSKIFRRLMGTTCNLLWRNEGDRELVWTVNPSHPIAAGVPSPLVIEAQEMYGEYFDIPTPEDLVFVSSFSGGEIFRSGCTFRRGHGKIVYFSPGDQDYPVYHHRDVRRVIANSVAWCAPLGQLPGLPLVDRAPAGWFEAAAP